MSAPAIIKSGPSEPALLANTNGQQLFDILASVTYLRSLGATAATSNFVRSLIASSQVPHLRIGKKFYLSKTSLDHWLVTRERRAR